MTTITERHAAVVSANDDPERRGRIKVSCVGLTGDEDVALPFWVEPVHDWGWFYVPDVGEQVEVEVVRYSSTDEVAGQAFLEEPDARWRGKRFFGGTESDAPTPVHDDLKVNYGKRRGFATPMGHTLVFDDTDGKTRVELTWVNADGQKSRLTVDQDGSAHVTILDEKHALRMLSTGEFHATLDDGKHSVDMLAADKLFIVRLDDEKHKLSLDGAGNELLVSVNQDAGKLSLTGDSLQVDLGTSQHTLKLDSAAIETKLSGQANLKVEGSAASAKLTVGSGDDQPVSFKEFKTWWQTVGPLIANHVHPVPAAGLVSTAPGSPVAGAATSSTSPGIASIGSAPPVDPNLKLAKANFPQGFI